MQLFFTFKTEGGIAYIDEEESRHVIKSLRKRIGDPIHLVDGKGNYFTGPIVERGKMCLVKIDHQESEFGRVPYNLHIAIAPTKNTNRFEWFLEKATEIGITSITPLICKRSERIRLKPERLNRILQSAMKQSLRGFLPELNEVTPFEEFISTDLPSNTQQFIAHCEDGEKTALEKAFQPNLDTVLLIGPEGDFTTGEINQAIARKFSPVTFGDSRLRTETAGVLAVSAIHVLHGFYR